AWSLHSRTMADDAPPTQETKEAAGAACTHIGFGCDSFGSRGGCMMKNLPLKAPVPSYPVHPVREYGTRQSLKILLLIETTLYIQTYRTISNYKFVEQE